MSGHTSFLTSLLQLPDGRLVTGSGDKDIRVWSLGDWSCVSVLSDHTGAVRCLVHLDDGSLASGSDDFTVKIWSVRSQSDSASFVMLIWNVYRARSSGSFSVERTLSGHTGFVMALMQLHNGSGSIVSGARDGLIKIWSRSGKRPIEHIWYNSAVSDCDDGNALRSLLADSLGPRGHGTLSVPIHGKWQAEDCQWRCGHDRPGLGHLPI